MLWKLLLTTLVMFVSIHETTAQEEACYLDVVFVVDDSSSISRFWFDHAKQFITDFLNCLPQPNDIWVGVIPYNCVPRTYFPLSPPPFPTLNNLIQMGGLSRTGLAIRYMKDTTNFRTLEIIGIPRTAIVLTDGWTLSTLPDVLAEANAARAEGIELYAVSIGLPGPVGNAELLAIAGSPNNVFTSDFPCAVASRVMGDLCISTPVTDGGWTTWGSWSDCDKTCGGGVQVRTRECSNPPPSSNGGAPCAGQPTQPRFCSQWECPDCLRVCTFGTLNAACDVCTCDNHVLNGHVTDTRNAPLEGCEVSFAEKPWEVATTTDSAGRFVLMGVCSQGTSILVRRAGFFDETADTTQVDSTTSSVRVILATLEPPIMDENPVGKTRLVGEDVTFCCNAHGTPMPYYYEWFKDDRLLDQDVYQYNGTQQLTLYNLQVQDSGKYKCRANSDAGAKYSSAASLTVHDIGTPFCDETPASKFIDLPDDCVQPGTSTRKYDIGTCSREKCAGDLGGDDKACLDTKKFCCSPVASETRTVQCDTYVLEVTVTTACGCVECVQRTKRVSGRAFGRKDGTEIPLSYGSVAMDGHIHDWATQSGVFEVEVPLTVDRVALTFKDVYFKQLITTTKVLPIKDGIEPYYTVIMQVRPPAVPLNPTETSTINLGTLAGQPPLAEVDIPPNSFFTESGDPYTGTVQASVGFIDPRNPDDFDAIQSDLTTVDEEGTQQALRTFGMFSMDFEDDVGNPVVMSGKMTIHIDPEQVNIDPNDVDENDNLNNTKMWSLNPSSGEWEFLGNLRVGTASRRRKRAETFFIGEFEYRLDRIINIDVIVDGPDRGCWAKVRVYKNENGAKNAIESEQVEQWAQVTVILRDTTSTSSGGLSSYLVTFADSDGACMPTVCDPSGTVPQFDTSVQVNHGDNYYEPLDSNDQPNVSNWPTDVRNSFQRHDEIATFHAFKPTAGNGPIYVYYDEYLCYGAPIADNHIAFYSTQYQPYSYPPYEFNQNQYDQPIDPRSWYNREDDQKNVCFIKVVLFFEYSDARQVEIRTISEGGGDYLPNAGYVYGIREDRTHPDSSDGRYVFACVEFKCPDPIMQSAGNGAPSIPLPGNPHDNVRLIVVAKDANCEFEKLNDNISNTDISSLVSEGNRVEFTVPFGNAFGATKGIYIEDGDKQNGYNHAREECMKGSSTNIPNSMLNWAIQFKCNDYW